jgi:small subunit ribosomal protein S21
MRGGEYQYMAKLIVKSSEPVKEALRRFKKMCDKEGIINRTKRGARFEKPSQRRRRRKLERLKTIRKAQRAGG